MDTARERRWNSWWLGPVTLVALLALSPVRAASAQGAPAAGDASRALSSLRALFQDHASELTAAQQEAVASSLKWLTQLSEGVRINPAMVRSLEADAQALSRLGTTSGAARAAVLDRVADDLQLKSAYCRTHRDGMSANVALTVRTWNGDQEVRRWQVSFVNAPLALLHGGRAEQFPAFSSPTTFDLPPGRYILWAQDPANPSAVGPAKEIALGRSAQQTIKTTGPHDSQKEALIADLSVPAHR